MTPDDMAEVVEVINDLQADPPRGKILAKVLKQMYDHIQELDPGHLTATRINDLEAKTAEQHRELQKLRAMPAAASLALLRLCQFVVVQPDYPFGTEVGGVDHAIDIMKLRANRISDLQRKVLALETALARELTK